MEPSWIAVYLGQRIVPEGYDQRADAPDAAGLARAVERLHAATAAAARAMPDHREYIATIGAAA